jgi:glycosyltransferase involved in cell wall biosynthesis
VGKIARLFHLKGHEYLIEAASRIVEKNPKVRFLFVGDGLLRKTLKNQIEARGLTDFFLFAGLVPPARIPEMLSAMDMVVHVSLREGLARVLPQALLSGIPAISYDIDGAREVVVTGETGILLPPKSIAPLSEAVLRLAGDASLREKLAAEGRRRCETVFRHEYMTYQIRDLYEMILQGIFPSDK